jgi:hypothetical protein
VIWRKNSRTTWRRCGRGPPKTLKYRGNKIRNSISATRLNFRSNRNGRAIAHGPAHRAGAAHGREGHGEFMGKELDTRAAAEIALDTERRLMNEALARLHPKTVKHGRGQGRLIFGLDLTGSRSHSLQQARIATTAMFDAIKSLGAVAVKLVYYRGSEIKASGWHDDPAVLAEGMRRLSCETGYTQIARLLRVALAEDGPVSGVVFIGDHCEDDTDKLQNLAQELGRKSMPLFVFHECADDDDSSIEAKPVFKRMAELSGGVYVEFRNTAGAVLRELLATVAALAVAGVDGVNRVAVPETPEARQLQGQLRLLAAPKGGKP